LNQLYIFELCFTQAAGCREIEFQYALLGDLKFTFDFLPVAFLLDQRAAGDIQSVVLEVMQSQADVGIWRLSTGSYVGAEPVAFSFLHQDRFVAAMITPCIGEKSHCGKMIYDMQAGRIHPGSGTSKPLWEEEFVIQFGRLAVVLRFIGSHFDLEYWRPCAAVMGADRTDLPIHRSGIQFRQLIEAVANMINGRSLFH